MEIVTNTFSLSKKEIFHLQVLLYLRSRKWLIIALLAVILISMSRSYFFTALLLAFVILYPLAIVWQCWSYTKSIYSHIFSLERYFTINESQISIHLSDGSNSVIMMHHVKKVMELNSIYLVYISKNQFIHIPKTAFATELDLAFFQQMMPSRLGR